MPRIPPEAAGSRARTGIAPAPSSAAASCNATWTAGYPASSITMIQGKLAQLFATTTAVIAAPGPPSHTIGPSTRRSCTSRPSSSP